MVVLVGKESREWGGARAEGEGRKNEPCSLPLCLSACHPDARH